MGFPFQPWPTFGEFKQRLCSDLRCTYETFDVQVNHAGRDGQHQCHCFRRAIKDGYRTAVVQPMADSQVMSPPLIRSILSRLGLPADATDVDTMR